MFVFASTSDTSDQLSVQEIYADGLALLGIFNDDTFSVTQHFHIVLLRVRDACLTLLQSNADNGIALDDGCLNVILLTALVGNVLAIISNAVHLPAFFLDDATAIGLVDVYYEAYRTHLVLQDVKVCMRHVEEHPEYALGLDGGDGQLVVLHILSYIIYATGIPLLHFTYSFALVRQESQRKRFSLRHEKRGFAFRTHLTIAAYATTSHPNGQRNSLIERPRVILCHLLEVLPEVSLGVGILTACGYAEFCLIEQVDDVLRER